MEQEKDTRITNRPPGEVASFEELTAHTQRLDQFYRSLMTMGTDYGVIPGTQKPTLYKAGAELLALWGGLTAKFEVDDTGTDWERGIFCYSDKCSLWKNGEFRGEAGGACSSLESKYRFRWVSERELPAGIDKSTLLMKEHTNSKTGGKWKTYRMENDSTHDLANTIVKMAEKRSFVGAVLRVTGASRIFTQDVEDMPELGGNGGTAPTTKPAAAKAAAKLAAKAKTEAAPSDEKLFEQAAPAEGTADGPLTHEQADRLSQAWLTDKVDVPGMIKSHGWADVTKLGALTKSQAGIILFELEGGATAPSPVTPAAQGEGA